MASIRGIKGFNPSSGTARLLAAYEQDVVNVATGLGYSLNLNTSNNVEFENFLNRVFIQNYHMRPLTYRTSTNKWTTEFVPRTPRSKYLKSFKSRMYLGNCKFTDPQDISDESGVAVTYPSRVFYSDLFLGEQLTWGLAWGRNGFPRVGTNIFNYSDTGDEGLVNDFVVQNIKVGDPLFFTSFDYSKVSVNKKQYFVSKVASPYRLEISEKFMGTEDSNAHWWVGSNYFDVSPDDGDEITGMGENSNRLLVFKLLSLWAYTGSQLIQAKDSVGTSSHRSIINKSNYTYYFHGSSLLKTGIYRYDGVASIKISRAIDPYIRGMSASSYTNVVTWEEGDEIRFFLGDITNQSYGISMTNAVATLHTGTGAWDVSPIADVITCSTKLRTSNQEDVYCGTSDDEILQMSDGYSFNTSPIHTLLDTKVYYPSGTDIINKFTKIQVIARNARGTLVRYKLWNMPTEVDDTWKPLGELTDDKTEFDIPTNHNSASGIQLRFQEIGTNENDALIEKFTFFYKPERTRLNNG